MKRVLYNTSIADPFVQVAQQLKVENGYEPVYWIGFNYDHSDEIVPKTFPDCVYQSYADAWKGIFSKEVQEKAASCYLDVDLLNDLAKYELQAMTMMNRQDHDRYSFNFMERERHYLNLIKSWTAVLDLYQVEMVVSAVAPHRVYDYVLYLLCQIRGIKFICMQYTLRPARVYATNNIYSIGNLFVEDYKRYLKKENLTKDLLPKDILESFQSVQKSYEEAKPIYMNTHERMNKRHMNLLIAFKDYSKRHNKKNVLRIFKKGSFSVLMRKNQKYSLEDSRFSVFDAWRMSKKKKRMNKDLQCYYQSLVTEPLESEKYIFLPLHYQPEATSSPAGDIFVNQRLCVETLLRNTPEDYLIYVKEHPQQFQSHTLGQTSRIKEFYSDLLKSKRVRLMPIEKDSFSILKNAKAVATITGTVGWEAVMHRIPVVIFGLIWYENMPGILRITDSASAKNITSFIESYHYDEHKILSYLMAVADNTVLAYHYAGEKEKGFVGEDDTIMNLKKLILAS